MKVRPMVIDMKEKYFFSGLKIILIKNNRN